MYQKSKGIFAIITHTYQPQPDDKVQVHERCEFVDKLTTNYYSSGTIILDLEHKKIVKNRTEVDNFSDFIQHIKDSYPAEFNHLIEVTGLGSKYGMVVPAAEMPKIATDEVTIAEKAD